MLRSISDVFVFSVSAIPVTPSSPISFPYHTLSFIFVVANDSTQLNISSVSDVFALSASPTALAPSVFISFPIISLCFCLV